ncbi:MAG: glycosyltransferase [Saprospiraceae bacterium]|nr:glycosyltransferase [Saprospiraceae bacterium]
MRIALLPFNVASDITNRVIYLNQIKDIEAKAFIIPQSQKIDYSNCELLPSGINSRNVFIKGLAILKYLYKLRLILKWADIIHWYWDFQYLPLIRMPIEYWLIKYYRKPGFIVWCGSEIRNPIIDSKINPYYSNVFNSGIYEYNFESAKRSNRTQYYFQKLGFTPLVFIGMDHYINKEYFKDVKRIFQVINVSKFEPKYPNVKLGEIVNIVHSASVTGGKGTEFILKAISKLEIKYKINFILINNVERRIALENVSMCDIFIDQLITGSHGTAAVEAMGFGKPVITYINPEIKKYYPIDLPIIEASPDNIEVVLEKIISNPESLNLIGRNSRLYVEKYHDDTLNAKLLATYYKSKMI